MTHVMLIEDTAYAGERNVRLHVSKVLPTGGVPEYVGPLVHWVLCQDIHCGT